MTKSEYKQGDFVIVKYGDTFSGYITGVEHGEYTVFYRVSVFLPEKQHWTSPIKMLPGEITGLDIITTLKHKKDTIREK